jgi:transglutaminase-like putative cysteine protease
MRLNIEHQTQYVYSEEVSYTIQQLRMTPQNGANQQVKNWHIKVDGQLHDSMDAFGNMTHTLVIDQPHDALLISVTGEVHTGKAGLIPQEILPLPIYLRDTPLTKANAAMAEFAKQFQAKPLEDMMHALRDKMHYISGATKVDTTAAEAFTQGQGVCQDHAHAFVGCCRSLGLPARYVSGYLFTDDGSLMQTHAWVEVWQNDAWLGLDVSNGIMVGEVHVRLASGLDYRSASPVTGTRVGGGVEGMSSSVIVNQESKLTRAERKIQTATLFSQAQTAQQ